jgi:hypothetical protein
MDNMTHGICSYWLVSCSVYTTWVYGWLATWLRLPSFLYIPTHTNISGWTYSIIAAYYHGIIYNNYISVLALGSSSTTFRFVLPAATRRSCVLCACCNTCLYALCSFWLWRCCTRLTFLSIYTIYFTKPYGAMLTLLEQAVCYYLSQVCRCWFCHRLDFPSLMVELMLDFLMLVIADYWNYLYCFGIAFLCACTTTLERIHCGTWLFSCNVIVPSAMYLLYTLPLPLLP